MAPVVASACLSCVALVAPWTVISFLFHIYVWANVAGPVDMSRKCKFHTYYQDKNDKFETENSKHVAIMLRN